MEGGTHDNIRRIEMATSSYNRKLCTQLAEDSFSYFFKYMSVVAIYLPNEELDAF